MSAIKRAVAQKTVLQQAELIVMAPIAVETIPAAEKALAAVQAAEDKVEQAQETVAAAHEDLPVDLAQMAEEFHAESVAFANENAGGEILLAQAGQEKTDDGGLSLMNDDGSLGTGGIAALVGLGVLAIAGSGGDSGKTDTGNTDVDEKDTASYDIEGPGVEYQYAPSGKSPGKFNLTWGDYDNDNVADDIRITWYPEGGGPNAESFHDLLNCGSVTSITVEAQTFTTAIGAPFALVV